VISLPAGTLHLFSNGRRSEADTEADNLIVGVRSPWRFPVALRDKELHGLKLAVSVGPVR